MNKIIGMFLFLYCPVMQAGVMTPTPGDWCEQVKKDFETFSIHMTDDHIAALDVDSYKKIIKQAVRNTPFRDLELIKEGHYKVMESVYVGLQGPQAYHTDKLVTLQERSVIFALKSRTIMGTRNNVKNQFSKNTLCPI